MPAKLFIAKNLGYLCAIEIHDMFELQTIYYFDPCALRINPDLADREHNFGFDDEQHHLLSYVHDHIAYRYEVLGPLGCGSFGHVFEALDHKSGDMVAVKVPRNDPEHEMQGYKEVKMLQQAHKAGRIPSAVHLREHFIFRRHLCMVFDLLEGGDLHIRTRSGAKMPLEHIRSIARDVTACLARLHE